MARGDAPLHFGPDQNVKWKIALPGKGNSSPVIWGDKVFVTTAVPLEEAPEPPAAPPPARKKGGRGFRPAGGALVEHGFDLLAIDRATGKVLWRRTAIRATPHEGFHNTYGSFASNSPVTDGEHVIAYFGSRGVYAYDLDGNLVWKKNLGVRMQKRNAFGEGAAPGLYNDTLVLVLDHEGPSVIVALDKNTGKELWRKDRDEPSSWSQPLIIEHDGKPQAIVSAPNKTRAYDLETGDVIWECAGLGLNTIPAPVYTDGMVYVMSGYRNPNLLAIRLGPSGDLTGSGAIVWTNTRGNSYSASPVIYGGKLYMLTDNGMLSCLNAKTGEPYYLQQRLPSMSRYKSSPVGVNGKLYIASENGDVTVVKMGETFEVLAENKFPDHIFIATPAVADGEIYLRSQSTLFCIRQ